MKPSSRLQSVLFGAEYERLSRQLPVIGEQKDIRYYSSPAKSVLNGPETTGMGFWSINPYIGCAFGCAYCYARYAHRYVMERAATDEKMTADLGIAYEKLPPWLAFERNIFVKKNAPEVLSRTLRFGSDRHLKLRGILKVLADHPGLSVVVITKSPLVTRDIDLLSRIARHSELCVHISLITLNRDLARRIEPRAPTPEARVRALARLREAGIEAGINCMPVLPGITDNPSDLEALVKRVTEAGATYVGACAVRLKFTARQRYIPFIEKEFPHLAERYRNTYASSAYAGEKYREGLARFFDKLCAKYKVRSWSRNTEDADEDEEPGNPALVPDMQFSFEL